MMDKRFGYGIQNSKSMPGADCDSDHNPLIITIKIRLERVKKSSKTVKWSINNLRKPEIRDAYRMQLDRKTTGGEDRWWDGNRRNLEEVKR